MNEMTETVTTLSADTQALLLKAAGTQSETEAETTTIPYISPKGKKFSIAGTKLGSSFPCVILADVFDHSFYDRKYDPSQDVSFGPACFAMGKSTPTMLPHEDSPNKQADNCITCDKNEFGSAENGKGKACRNGRRLLVASVSDGKVNFGDMAIINISPTALKGYSKYVKSINSIKKLPVWSVATTLTFDEDSPWPIVCPIFDGILDGDDIGTIANNVETYDRLISEPYDVSGYVPPTDAPARKSKMS